MHYTKRRLEVAELQVKRVIDAIEAEGGPKYRVVQYEPQGVPILPYVVEQDDGECQQQYHYETTHPFSLDICTLSVNGSDPLPVLMVPSTACILLTRSVCIQSLRWFFLGQMLENTLLNAVNIDISSPCKL